MLCHAPAEWFRRLEEPEGRRGRHGETWKTHWTTLPRSQWSKVLCHAPARRLTTGGTGRATGRLGRRTGLLFLVVSGPKCFATLQPSGFDDWKSQRDDEEDTGRLGRRTGLLFLVVSGPKCFATLQPSGFNDWKSQSDDGRHRESHGETWKTHWTTLPRSQWSKVLCHAPAEWFRRLEEPEGRREAQGEPRGDLEDALDYSSS